MKILILNWRDIKNPRAGGAELLTHEMAKRWVKAGHTVTLFSERFDGAVYEEDVDGVRIVRRGRWWSVHVRAMIYYLRHSRSTDVIIDEAHWFPFFSVLYAPRKTALLVCEVARPLFFRLFPYPIALIGRMLEKIYIFLYRGAPILAISDSTKEALVAEGLQPSQITVIPMGLSLPRRAKRYPKSPNLTVIVVARLHVFKGVADAIDAFARVLHHVPTARLWIVGGDSDGYQKELVQKVRDVGIRSGATFFGRVSEQKKFELLARAHILLMPSVHEGWGLVVAEAVSQGTPAVGYRTAGVKDVIVDGKTGVLVNAGKPDELAAETLKLWNDKNRYKRLQEAGRKRALSMNWDTTARAALSVLQHVHEK